MSAHDSSLFDLSFFDGANVVAVMEAYFDGSVAGQFLGVAGYLFRKKNVRPFEKKWRTMLRKHGLDHFHMTDCNAAKGPFAEVDCDGAARMAIDAIKEFAVEGMSAAIRPTDFYAVKGAEGLFNNPFSLCVQSVVAQCSLWASQNDPSARISYIFESGDDHQADAEKVLSSIADHPKRRAKFFYENHAFLPKRASLPTQAADVLAWHVTKQWTREANGVADLRGDFSTLVETISTRKQHFDKDGLQDFLNATVSNAPVPNPERIAGLFLRLSSGNAKAINREVAALLRAD